MPTCLQDNRAKVKGWKLLAISRKFAGLQREQSAATSSKEGSERKALRTFDGDDDGGNLKNNKIVRSVTTWYQDFRNFVISQIDDIIFTDEGHPLSAHRQHDGIWTLLIKMLFSYTMFYVLLLSALAFVWNQSFLDFVRVLVLLLGGLRWSKKEMIFFLLDCF